MMMRSLSFVFLVLAYFTVHINGGAKPPSKNWNRTGVAKLRGNTVNISGGANLSFVQGLNVSNGNQAIFQLASNEEKGKLCLRNLTKCSEEDAEYESTSKIFSKMLFEKTTPFDLSRVRGVSPLCREQSLHYIKELQQFKLWAVKMYDSTAKLPSGILNGNLNQLGDFDMCLGAKSDRFESQYCLASMQFEAPNSPYFAALHRLAQSHFHFKSDLSDPGHRVPRYSSVNWALCVPRGCSPQDVEKGLAKNVKQLLKGSGMEVQVRVDPDMCQSSREKEVPVSTIITASIFLGVALLTIAAGIYDLSVLGPKNEWIITFSLRRNFSNLLSTKRSPTDIEAIHGIRFINAILLVLAHKSMALFFVPYTNRTETTEFLTRPWSVLARAASLFTDPFIMISATLTSYALLRKLQRTNRINVLEEYFSRLFRIVPTFAALIAFCTFLLPFLNSGPMWPLVVTHHSDICKKYWWRNLLFIHNYFGFQNMCLTHTHHVGIDTQLFFVSPFLVLLLYKWPKKGAATLLALATVSTIMRYYVTYTMKLSNYVHFGTSIQQLFATADNMYILPVHRATVYIMGIILGYILINFRTISLSKAQLRVGNALAILSFFASLFSPAFMGTLDYVYDATDAAWYAAFTPIMWCFSFGWLIFTTHAGYGGAMGRIASWSGFRVWTKISYTVYLTQFPIFFYSVGTVRTPQHYNLFPMMFNFQEWFWIVLFSTVLTLLFESPFQNIKNLVFKREVDKDVSNKLKTK